MKGFPPPPLIVLPGSNPARMLPSFHLHFERHFLVTNRIPAEAMQRFALNFSHPQSFP